MSNESGAMLVNLQNMNKENPFSLIPLVTGETKLTWFPSTIFHLNDYIQIISQNVTQQREAGSAWETITSVDPPLMEIILVSPTIAGRRDNGFSLHFSFFWFHKHSKTFLIFIHILYNDLMYF